MVAAALLATGCASTDPGVVAREASPIAPRDRSADPVPQDPDVRIVTLANGLTVYLRANDRPGESAEMRLVINAGSGEEESDQSGTAHFLEHMMFNGTTKYPANELIDTLRGFGMQFGADVNAFTSYDETVYELTVPLSDSANLDTGIDVLREWLSAATLDADQVESEKGVVLDEWRQRDQTLDGRIGGAAEELLLQGSGYEGRRPIGSDTAIKAMTPGLLRRFYDTWYRPDNAAVMIVGDIDVDEVESKVRDRFEGLTSRGESGTTTGPALAPFGEPAAEVLLDPDATTGDAEVILPSPVVADGTIGSLRHHELISLAFDMITTRLADDISRGAVTFTSASFEDNSFVRGLDAPSVLVSGPPDQLSATIDAVTHEFERARRFGFDDAEFDRVMRNYRSSLQADLDGSDTVQDLDYVSRYVDHFLNGQTIADAETSYGIYSEIYNTITPDEVATAFEDLFASAPPHVLVVAPDSSTDPPTNDDVLATIAGLSTIDLEPRASNGPAATELMTAPEPVEETSSESLPGDDGFVAPTMLTFANGARVVLNPTEIADNDVYFSATSPGGLSLVADADVPEALSAASVVTASGIGTLDPVELDTVLSDANLQLYPSINQTSEDFVGTSTSDDIELLFQLVNLYMSQPRFDDAALASTVGSLQAYVDDPNSDPDLASYMAYSEARFGSEPRFRVIPTQQELAGLDLDTIERVWRQRFTNPADWVFAVSGDFDLVSVTDLARRYFGTLTGSATTEQYKDFQVDPPSSVVTEDVHAGTGDKGSLTLDWSAAVPDADTAGVYADVLTSVLNNRLTDHIREQLGASYSPSAFVSVNPDPDDLVETYLNITGDPTTIAQLSQVVIADVADLRQNGPSAAEFDAAIAEITQTYSYFDNQSIGDVLVKAPTDPEVLTQFNDRAGVLDDVTAATVQTFITQVMPIDRYIEVRTVPA
jgi:zinc protease